jgi:flagellar biosynthesis protein
MSTPDPRAPLPGSSPAPTRVVALRYDEDEARAPRVVASGAGEVAQHILDVARAKGVPVREDADLVALLAACDLGEEIPLELYEAVAELLTWLYRLNAALGE